MTQTPLSGSKGQRSPGRFAHRRVDASGGCSGGRGNVLAVGNCCYVAVCSAAQGASAPTGKERGGAYRGSRPPTTCLFIVHTDWLRIQYETITKSMNATIRQQYIYIIQHNLHHMHDSLLSHRSTQMSGEINSKKRTTC